MFGLNKEKKIKQFLLNFTLENSDKVFSEETIQKIDLDQNELKLVLKLPTAFSEEAKTIHAHLTEALKEKFNFETISLLLTNEKPSHFQVKHVLAVASGKGGVGKSTVAFNLAHGFKNLGYKVGLMDADIYGPSFPILFPHANRPLKTEDKKIIPHESDGIKAVSMGLIMDEDAPVIWRGPMASKAIQQLFFGTKWDDLDLLILDLPPGTGDIHLTLCQKMPITAAVIVSTPQDLALIDMHKGKNMFEKINIPILGWIENMSYFVCPNCNHESHIFAKGSLAEKTNLELLGQIPLNIDLQELTNSGKSVFDLNQDHPAHRNYSKIIQTINKKTLTKEKYQ